MMLFLLYVTVGAPAVGHELDFGSSPLAAERLVDLATTHLSPITIDLHIVILLPSSFTAAPSAIFAAIMSGPPFDPEFPCSLIISVPLPTHRLASSALRALSVDAELSPLVHRSFSLACPYAFYGLATNGSTSADAGVRLNGDAALAMGAQFVGDEELTVLRTEYKATTNRMLRVAVNGFMESLGVVLGVMEELDVDVLAEEVQ